MSISIQTLSLGIFWRHIKNKQVRCLHWNEGNSYPHTEIMSILTTHTKPKLIPAPTLKSKWFQSPLKAVSLFRRPHTKTKPISTLTQNKSQLRPMHCNQVNFDPLLWNQVNSNHPRKYQINFDYVPHSRVRLRYERCMICGLEVDFRNMRMRICFLKIKLYSTGK